MNEKNNQLTTKEINNFNKNLLAITDRWRTRPTKNSTVNQSVYVIAEALYEKHNCDAYFITLTMPQKQKLLEQWQGLRQIIKSLIEGLTSKFLVAGALIGIEMHKRSSKYNKLGGKDLKAGYPHIHMVLWTYHEFFNPTINDLRAFLLKSGFEINVKKTTQSKDVKNAILYTIKDTADEQLKNICHQALNRQYSAFIYVNHKDCLPLFEDLAQQLASTQKNYQIGIEYGDYDNQYIIPTVKRIEDQKLMLAILFRKIFEQRKWAVFDDYVYEPIQDARYTWKRWITLNSFISNCYNHNLPAPFLTMLSNSAHWLAVQGAVNKNSPKLDLFPQLFLEAHFVEFYDGVYNFTKALFTKEIVLSPFASCTNFHPTNFNQLEPPLHILGFLFTLLASDKDESAVLEKVFQPQKLQHHLERISCLKTRQHEKIRHAKWECRKIDQLYELLKTMGGIFHPETHRKANPALFILGDPSSYKTFILTNFLKSTFGEHQIKVISKTGGRFTFGFLTRNNKVTIFMDDIQWDQLGVTATEFINLIDGNPIAAEQKYQKGTQVQHEGALVLTGNSPLKDNPETYDNNGLNIAQQKALEKRITTIQFHAHQDPVYTPKTPELKYIKEECINLSILANAIYLNAQKKHVHFDKNEYKLPDLPQNWHDFAKKERIYGETDTLFANLGTRIFHFIIKNLLKHK